MDKKKTKKVFVGMSGGVDSSVAAFLLKEQGYDVTGVFINGFNVDGCQNKDAEDARRAADHIKIPFYALDAREEYFEQVVQYMIREYRGGRTPNPDVMCNKEIKFGIFLDKALKLGAEYIATGHYVCRGEYFESQGSHFNNEDQNLEFALFEAKDKNKDQSYFLWTLTQEQLRHCLFPLGTYTKPEVRSIARHIGLPNADKKDSQGICFLGKIKLSDFLKEYIKPKKGDVLDIEGNKIGEHDGVQFYTIGQRHINIIQNSKFKSQKHQPDRKPYYIVSKDVETNTLIVAEGGDHPALFKSQIRLSDVHFINPQQFQIQTSESEIPVLVRVRYRQPLVEAMLAFEGNQNQFSAQKLSSIRIIFKNPQKFIAPGQSAVLYTQASNKWGSHALLGGGVILEE